MFPAKIYIFVFVGATPTIKSAISRAIPFDTLPGIPIHNKQEHGQF